MRITAVITIAVVSALQAIAAGPEQTVTISSGKTPVLQLKTIGKTDVTPIGNKTVVHTPDMFLHIWPQPKDATIKNTIDNISTIIKGDFTNFKPQNAKLLKLGRNTVKLIAGPGVEADDGDDGNAEVAIFKVGDRVFVACIHGEGPVEKAEHNAMLAAIKSAHKPSAK